MNESTREIELEKILGFELYHMKIRVNADAKHMIDNDAKN